VQLKALRPDLEYVPIRGNIQTRLGKLAELDGVVLAAAGLKRMGLADQVTEYFSTEQMLPASGQGILAIETLNVLASHEVATQSIDAILSRVNDAESYAIAVAEMAYLKALNAGCQFPVASFAEFNDATTLALRGIYWDESGKRLLRAEIMQPVNVSAARAADAVAQARAAGYALAEKIREQL
jgi:hydroxymethylbilane synthase